MRTCFRCKTEWVSEKRVPGVKEMCESCGAYLHCCRNCKHHDPRAHNQCLIPNTEWVGDREGCNFCDEFEFVIYQAKTEDTTGKNAAKNKLDALFGDAPGDSESAKLDKFKNLFGD